MHTYHPCGVTAVFLAEIVIIERPVAGAWYKKFESDTCMAGWVYI